MSKNENLIQSLILKFTCAGLLIFALLLNSCITPAVLITKEQQMGDDYNNKNDYSEAIRHYFKSLESSMKLGIYRNYDMEAELGRKLAHAYETQGKYNDAFQFLSLAYSLDSSQNNKLKIIEDTRLEGMNKIYSGDIKAGMHFLEMALNLNAGMEESFKSLNQLSVAQTDLDLAKVKNAFGYLEESRKYAESAMAIFKSLNNDKGIMESQLTLANIYMDLGLTVEAEYYTNLSLEKSKGAGLTTARQEQLLSEISGISGKYQDALKHLNKALDEAELSNILPQILWSHVNLGDIYQLIGNKEKANTEYSKALNLKETKVTEAEGLQASLDYRMDNLSGAFSYFSKSGSLIASGLTAIKLGEMYLKDNKVDSSISFFSQAGTFFATAGNNEGLTKSHLGLANGEVLRKNTTKAKDLYNSVISVARDPETLWKANYRKGILYESIDSIKAAIFSYKEAIKIIEKIRQNFSVEELKEVYFDNRIDVYNRLILLLIKTGDESSAWSYSERSRSRTFLDMLANRKINIKKNADTALVNKEQDLRLQIRNLNVLSEKILYQDFGDNNSRSITLKETEEELVRAEDNYTTVLQKLKLSNPDYAEMISSEPQPLAEVQKTLDKQTGILEYWVGESQTTVWIISKSFIKSKVIDIDATKLAAMVEEVRNSIESRQNDQCAKQLKKLYELLVSPALSDLQFTNLGIIPHNILHFLPFGALLNEKNEYLVSDFNLFYAPSANVYRQCLLKPRPNGSHFLGMALGDLLVGSFSSLPGTERELRSIGKLFTNPTITVASESKESYFKKVSGQYDILHLATHGFFNSSQPLYSFLLFAQDSKEDGRLTAQEIFGLDLKARLVTLSACETGLGEITHGDELVGLSRAFIYAGTPAVIVSLWSVADEPTAILMNTFYQNMRNHTIQEALTLAQREVLKKYPSPFYWAPFILIGSGTDQVQ